MQGNGQTDNDIVQISNRQATDTTNSPACLVFTTYIFQRFSYSRAREGSTEEG